MRFKKNAKLNTHETLCEKGLTIGKLYFKTLYSTANKPWYSTLNKKREFIVTVNRCRSDHYNLAASLYRVGITQNPTCKCTKFDENLNHVLWQCDLYNSQRATLLKSLKNLDFSPPLSAEMFLQKPHLKACLHILSFLNDCNLKV